MSREPIRIHRNFKIHEDAFKIYYAVLDQVSLDYPPDTGMLLTRYAPLRRSPPSVNTRAAPRLACVKPAASVHPEPGSNSSLYKCYLFLPPDTQFINSKN